MVEARILLGQWGDEESAQSTPYTDVRFHAFATKCLEDKRPQLSDRGAKYIEWGLTLHLLPFFAEHAIREFDEELIRSYVRFKVAEREEVLQRLAAGERLLDARKQPIRPLADSSINKTLEILASVLSRAVGCNKPLEENPAADKSLWLKAEKPRRSWLMPDQVLDLIYAAERIGREHKPQTRERAEAVQALRTAGRTLAEAAKEPGLKLPTVNYLVGLRFAPYEPSMRRAIIATLGLTGLRASELCALRWRHIDFVNRTIEAPGTKSAAARRSIKILDYLLAELHPRRSVAAGRDLTRRESSTSARWWQPRSTPTVPPQPRRCAACRR